MKRALLLFVLAIGLAVLGGGEANAQTVSGSIGNGTVARGGSARGTVILTIPGDLHVNSNQPNSKYAIPTTVRLTAEGARVSAVQYPRGKNKKFEFSETPINVYEGRVTFGFNVTVPASFKGNVVRVRAVVRFQACNNEVCFPPRNQEVTLTANVR